MIRFHEAVWGLKEVLNWDYFLLIMQRATTDAWGAEIMLKTAIEADGIDRVGNGPGMDQLQPRDTQKVRRRASLPLPPHPIIIIHDPFTHL